MPDSPTPEPPEAEPTADAEFIPDVIPAKPPQPLMSAVMIIRNESRRLARCLASIRPIVEQICIVDTGSTDDSIDIARSFGAEVIESPWADDFSRHRNEAADMAVGKWLLIIDGDEEFETPQVTALHACISRLEAIAKGAGQAEPAAPDIARLRGIAETATADAGAAALFRKMVETVDADAAAYSAILLPVETRGDGGLRQQFLAQRIVRNGAYRYAYPIHNQLIPKPGVTASEIATQDGLIVSHYTGEMGNKAKRSLPMLQKLWDTDEAAMWASYGLEKPSDVPGHRAHAAFFMTKTYSAIGDHAKVVEWGVIAEQLCGNRPNFAELWCWLYYARLALMAMSGGATAEHHALEARCALERGIALHPHFTDLRRARTTEELLTWQRMARTPMGQAYSRCSASGLQAVAGIPEASKALGIPIVWTTDRTKGGAVQGELPVKAAEDAPKAPF